MNLWKMLAVVAALGAVSAGAVWAAEAEKKVKRHAVEKESENVVAYLGVAAQPLDPVLARHMKMRPGTGLIVAEVDTQGPSRDLIQTDDILKELDGQLLVNFDQLTTLVRLHQPGEEASLVLVREGELKKITVKLGERELAPEPAQQPWPLMQNMPNWRGRAMPNPRLFQFAIPEDNGPDAVPPPKHDAQREKPKAKPEPPKEEANVSMSFSTVISQTMDDHVVTYTDNNGAKSLKVADAKGQVLYDGPVSTDEQIKALPQNVRGFYDKIKAQAGGIQIKTRKGPASGDPRLET